MRPPPQGQVVINLKTTITAHGTHSGVIVHSGIQSSDYPYSGSSNGSLWSLNQRIPQIETPGGTRIAGAASPLPLTIGPSTSQDNLNTSWNRPYPSPQPPTRSGSFDHLSHGRRIHQERPPTPPSPVYDFTGRNTPPDEFIQPSKITLNVFDPGRRTPTSYDVGLRRSSPSSADALINDTVTTTTTVEVFRTPLDPSGRQQYVNLPPPPAPGLDDRPQVLRLNGPPYEKWSNTKSETLINDRPVMNKAVQWREKLVDRGSESDEYTGNRLVDSRSPFANAVMPPRPASSTHQYYIPTVHHVDERLVPPMVSRSTSPYMVQSPSEFTMTTHPMITSSQEERSRSRYSNGSTRANSAMGYQQPMRTFETPSNMAQMRVNSGPNGNTPIMTSQMSPLYVEPRAREQKSVEVDRYGYSTIDHRPPRDSGRRSKSVHRKKTREEELRARSVSPLSRRPSWAEDPNRLPNMPRIHSPRDSYHLYETRDAFDNVVSQFSELEMFDLGAGLLLSPLAESEESIISETSARNDMARSDYLENRPVFDIYRVADKFYESRNPLMQSKSADHIYARPRSAEMAMTARKYAEPEDEDYEEEHIYEDLDSVRASVSTSKIAQIYNTVAPEYEEIPPPLPPRRRKPTEVVNESSDESSSQPTETTVISKEKVEEKEPVKSDDVTVTSDSEVISRPTELVSRPTELGGMSSSEEEQERWKTPMNSSDSGSALSSTTADSTDSGEGPPSFAELTFLEDDWPPPPQMFRRPRKAHPDGHVFPRITSSVVSMPKLPEDSEFSQEEFGGGIALSPLLLEVFEREPKPASPSPVFRPESPVEHLLTLQDPKPDEKSPGSTGTTFEEEDLPFVDASPRVSSP